MVIVCVVQEKDKRALVLVEVAGEQEVQRGSVNWGRQQREANGRGELSDDLGEANYMQNTYDHEGCCIVELMII